MEKRHSSIKLMIVVPMLILGIVSVISNILAIRNIKNVNANASDIADHYMAGTQELSEIQKSVQNIHKMALTHILAMDFDTMIRIVEEIKEKEKELDNNGSLRDRKRGFGNIWESHAGYAGRDDG